MSDVDSTSCRICDCKAFDLVPSHYADGRMYLDGCRCGHIGLAHNNEGGQL